MAVQYMKFWEVVAIPVFCHRIHCSKQWTFQVNWIPHCVTGAELHRQ